MSNNLKVKLSVVLRDQSHRMDCGRPVLNTPFLNALRKLAEDPVQEFSVNYWAGKALKQAQEWVTEFLTKRDALMKQYGILESEQLKKINVKSEADEKRIKFLGENPVADQYSFEPTEAEAFQREVKSALEAEVEFAGITRRFMLVPERTVKGERVRCALDGVDTLYVDDLIELPTLTEPAKT